MYLYSKLVFVSCFGVCRFGVKRERERERQTDRQTDRQKQSPTKRDREKDQSGQGEEIERNLLYLPI